jgi:tetratricopeptide (TPR) repeat protein
MSPYPEESLFNDPNFYEAMRNFQNGQWKDGLIKLREVGKNYPSSQQDLRVLHREMQVRARIDQYEHEERVHEQRRQIKILTFSLVGGILLLVLAFMGVRSYSAWVGQQFANTRLVLNSQIEVVESSVNLRDGENLLQAGQAREALARFEEVASAHPNLPGLEEYIQKAKDMEVLESKYEQATGLQAQGDVSGALALYEEISTQNKFYKDVSIRIEQLRRQSEIEDVFAQAESAFQSNDWTQSASRFESIRNIDPEYKSEFVEDRLFNSYVNVAVNALNEQSDSSENMEIAETYFRKALALRPQDKDVLAKREQVRELYKVSLAQTYVAAAQATLQEQADSLLKQSLAEEYFRKALALRPNDPQILQQREFARRFLQAQENFSNDLFDEAIVDLEFIYAGDPEYALGTARQTLFEAYMSRGKTLMAGGEFETALSDFRRAAVIAEQIPEAGLALYTARINVAEAQGSLGDYEGAVLVYRDALSLIDLDQNILEDSAKTRTDLNEAERYADLGYYRTAFRLFRQATPNVLAINATFTHVVESGDYLTMLANRYHTTVEAILQANKLSDPKQIKTGQNLTIPGANP